MLKMQLHIGQVSGDQLSSIARCDCGEVNIENLHTNTGFRKGTHWRHQCNKRCFYMTGAHKVDHSKVLAGVKKERNQWFSVWSKVFLDKGIVNRTIGQSLRVDFPKSKPSQHQNRKRKLSFIGCSAGDVLLAIVSGFGFDVAACAPLCLRRGIRVRPCSLRLCVYLPFGLQVQPIDLSWPCLLRATEH